MRKWVYLAWSFAASLFVLDQLEAGGTSTTREGTATTVDAATTAGGEFEAKYTLRFPSEHLQPIAKSLGLFSSFLAGVDQPYR